MTDDDPGGPANEAFALLGHEIRLGILEAFFDRHEPIPPESFAAARERRTQSYSDLMDAVGMRDSGKFNYHLEQLLGVYVEKVEGGYVPTASAVAIHRAVVANRPTDPSPAEPLIENDCPNCGTALEARYEQEYLTVECPACDVFWGLSYAFPKNGLAVREGESASENVFEALYDRMMFHVGLARTGQCPSCAGVVEPTIPRDRLAEGRVPTVELTCEHCSWLVTVDVLSALQFEPRVTATLVELGVSPDGDGGLQATEELLGGVSGRVTSTKPLRVAIEVDADDGDATVVVDEDLDVVSVTVT